MRSRSHLPLPLLLLILPLLPTTATAAPTTHRLTAFTLVNFNTSHPINLRLSSPPPFSVSTALTAAKLTLPPFLGNQTSVQQWVSLSNWSLLAPLPATAGPSALRFDSLDGPAAVYLGDRLLLAAANAFHPHYLMLSDPVPPGTLLRIDFASSIAEGVRLAHIYSNESTSAGQYDEYAW